MIDIKTFQVNPLQENCYVVSDETKECVIIDCGAFGSDEQQEIIQYIKQNDLKPVHLLATHGHFDHNIGNKSMYDAFGLKPEIHSADAKLLSSLPEQAQSLVGMMVDANQPPIGKYLSSNEIVTFGNHSFKCILSPGHTMGGIVLYCEEENVAFSGDTLFRQSIGRTDLPGGSMFMIINSLRYLCQLPDNTVVYPGHGPQTTIGFELAHNPYLER